MGSYVDGGKGQVFLAGEQHMQRPWGSTYLADFRNSQEGNSAGTEGGGSQRLVQRRVGGELVGGSHVPCKLF